MKKIVDYIKNNYIVCMVVIAILLVIIGSFIIIKVLVIDDNKIETKSENVSYYQYFETTKNSFKAKQNFENNKMVSIKPKDGNIYENSMLYYKNSMKVTLPKDMAMVFFYKDNTSNLLPKYSEIENEEGTNIVHTGGNKYLIEDFFLYDGEDLYFFISDTTLTINGENYDLTRYSYVYARNNSILYYDYENDNAVVINEVKSASIKVKSIDIDLLKDAVVDNGKVSILVSMVEDLPIYKED